MQTAIFGGGCFWCTEAVFQQLKGVNSVISGYMGGSVKHPTYKEVCDGTSGHAEVIKIEFNEEQVSFNQLLLVFFKTHDPTTLNRQGNDAGTQYRSVIFYLNESQRKEAEEMINQLDSQQVFGDRIVTEVSEAEEFYPAEAYHQNYYNQNQLQPYCSFVIAPKLTKFAREFSSIAKS